MDEKTKALAAELVSQIEPKLKAFEDCGDPEQQDALIDVLWGNKAHILHVLWMTANILGASSE